jgi:hypothetical protein
MRRAELRRRASNCLCPVPWSTMMLVLLGTLFAVLKAR